MGVFEIKKLAKKHGVHYVLLSLTSAEVYRNSDLLVELGASPTDLLLTIIGNDNFGMSYLFGEVFRFERFKKYGNIDYETLSQAIAIRSDGRDACRFFSKLAENGFDVALIFEKAFSYAVHDRNCHTYKLIMDAIRYGISEKLIVEKCIENRVVLPDELCDVLKSFDSKAAMAQLKQLLEHRDLHKIYENLGTFAKVGISATDIAQLFIDDGLHDDLLRHFVVLDNHGIDHRVIFERIVMNKKYDVAMRYASRLVNAGVELDISSLYFAMIEEGLIDDVIANRKLFIDAGIDKMDLFNRAYEDADGDFFFKNYRLAISFGFEPKYLMECILNDLDGITILKNLDRLRKRGATYQQILNVLRDK